MMYTPGKTADQQEHQQRKKTGRQANGHETDGGNNRSGDEQKPFSKALGQKPRRHLGQGHGPLKTGNKKSHLGQAEIKGNLPQG